MPSQLALLKPAPDLVDQVYRALLDAISTGSLASGERLTQEDLAERFGVSRQPVLQALRQLKKDGFVTETRGRGVLVSALDAQRLLMVYQVRGALDGLAARLAAQQRAVIDRQLIVQGRRAAEGKDVQAMIDADLAFHQAIYRASRNSIIEQAASQHWQHLRRAMGAVLQQSGQRATVWDEHETIARAIADGDAPGAAALIEAHAQRAGSTMNQQLTLAQAS